MASGTEIPVEGLPSTSTAHEISDVAPPAAGSEDQLIRWDDSQRVTPLAPLLPEWIERVETIRDYTMEMIERIRASAQPNRAYRGIRLVPSDVNKVSERTVFASSLPEFAGKCFDTLPQLRKYTKGLMEVELQIEKHHETFLRQVMIYSVKPMMDYSRKTYPKILRAYENFLNARDKYDGHRRKGAKEKSPRFRNEFVESARVLLKLLMQVPHELVAVAKAVDNYLRAEVELGRKIHEIGANFKPPDHVHWWQPTTGSE